MINKVNLQWIHASEQLKVDLGSEQMAKCLTWFAALTEEHG